MNRDHEERDYKAIAVEDRRPTLAERVEQLERHCAEMRDELEEHAKRIGDRTTRLATVERELNLG
jgi:hypothetical protein